MEPSKPSSGVRPVFATRHPFTRRRLLVGAGSTVALAALGTGLSAVAQGNATPAPAQGGGATPSSSPVNLPTIPPELAQYANDWPAPQGNVSNHRAAANSAIKASNVGSLEVSQPDPGAPP